MFNPTTWYHERKLRRQRAQHYQAKLNGYGWAWAAYKIEGMSLDEIEGYLWNPVSYSAPTGSSFDIGASMALDDIRIYLATVLIAERPSASLA